MVELRIRNRARLRRKEIEELAAQVQAEYGTTKIFGPEEPLERGNQDESDVLLLGNEVIGLFHEGKAGLSVRGLLKYVASKRFVTVDMGAVRFVTNGADVMGPGIVDADPGIKTGDLVWVREERHGKPLAIGVALADGPGLTTKAKGKQVKSLHYVGDRLWLWGQEEPEGAA
ncbi:MAG TPA: PUA domain-containing protein [Candidatus Thermoplasmatota archaeon]|nr:PUA domain-containing protein [Candidatus Thermoplasmatota archaeon]